MFRGVAVLPVVAAVSWHEIVDKVNNQEGVQWKAQVPSKFGAPEDVKDFLGAFVPGDAEYDEPPTVTVQAANGIPDAFDAATNWPDCAPVISLVRDQSACGTCWAFGSVESFEDRACIATGKPIKYSAEDTGFNSNAGMGCNGGNSAWTWFKNTGVVTGGDYTDIGGGDTCLPYSLAPCAHHVPPTDKYPACPGEGPSPIPGRQCSESGYSTGYAADKVKALTAFSVKGIDQIQTEIMTNGPLYVTFTVYDDFPTYKSGVYHRTSLSMLGGHAVENVGWGTLDGQAYWRIKNSWNEEWGDGGHFKIRRGNNECGIESGASGGTFEGSPMPPAPPGECAFQDCMTCLFSYCGGGGSCGGSHDSGTFKCQCADGGMCGDNVFETKTEFTAVNGQIV
jgi:cathepsin B